MAFEFSSSIRLQLSPPQTVAELSFQLLTIELASPDRLIEPQDLTNLILPEGIDTTGGVMITGRAPIWLYAALVHELHPTAWVACFDPRLNGGVVVATHSRQTHMGQVIPLCPDSNPLRFMAPALMIVGPPDSGKSVFSHALFTALLPRHPEIFSAACQLGWRRQLDSGTAREMPPPKNRKYSSSSTRAILAIAFLPTMPRRFCSCATSSPW
jgi:CRISPR-associated Csx3 family protein